MDVGNGWPSRVERVERPSVLEEVGSPSALDVVAAVAKLGNCRIHHQ